MRPFRPGLLMVTEFSEPLKAQGGGKEPLSSRPGQIFCHHALPDPGDVDSQQSILEELRDT